GVARMPMWIPAPPFCTPRTSSWGGGREDGTNPTGQAHRGGHTPGMPYGGDRRIYGLYGYDGHSGGGCPVREELLHTGIIGPNRRRQNQSFRLHGHQEFGEPSAL